MKNLLLIAAAISVAACNGNPGHLPSSGSGPRTPTIEEAAGRRMKVEVRYDPDLAPSLAWVAWRGSFLLELNGPQAGLDHLPAVLTPVSGLEDLDPGCLAGPQDGSWVLEPDGSLVVMTVPSSPGGATVELRGRLQLRNQTPAPDDSWGSGEERTEYLVCEGVWVVRPGINCGPDDFSGGTGGLFDALEDEAAPVEPDPEELVAPNATVVLVDDHGHTVRVTGPAAVILRSNAGNRVR